MPATAEKAAPPPGPKFRHYTVAPRTITVPVHVLLSQIPAEARAGEPQHEMITVPCAELLGSHVPRVRTAVLREWLPGVIADDAELPEWIPLSAAALALRYQPETVREEIPEPEEAPAETLPELAAPVEEPKPIPSRRSPSWKRILKPVPEPVQEAPADPQSGEPPIDPEPEPVPEASDEQSEPNPPVPASPPLQASAPQLPRTEALQAIYMTDEPITHQTLADLIGRLPAIQACALTLSDEMRRSENVPQGFDVKSTRDRLLALLDQSGVNVLTLHPEGHPVSILRHGSCNLLVIHRDRPFLPGVRERLAQTLNLLADR